MPLYSAELSNLYHVPVGTEKFDLGTCVCLELHVHQQWLQASIGYRKEKGKKTNRHFKDRKKHKKTEKEKEKEKEKVNQIGTLKIEKNTKNKKRKRKRKKVNQDIGQRTKT